MIKIKRQGKKMGQSTIEYAILIFIVSAAFLAMRIYVQRAVRANLKVLEDQINAHATDPF